METEEVLSIVTMSMDIDDLNDIAVEGFVRFRYGRHWEYESDEFHDPTWHDVLQCVSDTILDVDSDCPYFLEDIVRDEEAEETEDSSSSYYGVAIYMLHIGS